MNFGHCHYAREEFILMRNEDSERNPMDARCPHLARLDGCPDTLFLKCMAADLLPCEGRTPRIHGFARPA